MNPLNLESLLAPLSVACFRSQYLGQQFFYSHAGENRFSHLLPWETLNDLLRRSYWEYPRLRLVRNGSLIDPERYTKADGGRRTVSSAELTQQLREGATLVLDGISELYEPITRLAERLERALEARVSANAYAGWRTSNGFDLHYDDHDVFILQVSGRKHWELHGVTGTFPLKRSSPGVDLPAPTSGPVWQGLLDQGDMLYIPRGWWHVAVPCDEPTLHITVSFTSPTGVTVLQWLAGALAEDEFFRKDIPRFSNETQEHYASEFSRKIMGALSDSHLLQHFTSEWRQKAESRPFFNLPFSATEAVLPDKPYSIRLVSPRDPYIQHLSGTDDIEVNIAGKAYTFDEATAPLFGVLRSGEPISVESFFESFQQEYEPEALQTYLSDLVKHGLLAVSPMEKLHQKD